jgi:hypothetical protein
VESSSDLVTWTASPTIAGTGELLEIEVTGGPARYFRVRISRP